MSAGMSEAEPTTRPSGTRPKWPSARRCRTPRSPAKTIEKGLLIVHTGPGKGKSTAASAWCCGRSGAAGASAWCSSSRAPGRPASAPRSSASATRSTGTRWARASPGRRRTARATSPPPRRAWAQALELMADPTIRLIVLDELNIALRYDYLPLAEVVAALRRAARDLHVVVTGRNAKPELIEAADLVTEMALGQASFRRRREGAGRHRVLTWRARADVPGHRLGRRQVAASSPASAAPSRGAA